MSDESINSPSTPNKMLNPSVNYVGTKARVTFNRDISSYPTLENSLFGAVKLTKHIDIDLHKYSEYGIGFDRKGFFSISDEVGRSVIIFGVNMSSSPHTNNKKYILILGKHNKEIF